MLCVPLVVKVFVSTAVPPAPAKPAAPVAVTVTGLPICVPPSKKVTVPVVPTELLLCELIVAVMVIGVPDATVVTLGTMPVAVAAFDTTTASTTAVATEL
jgi:hypothetical protein